MRLSRRKIVILLVVLLSKTGMLAAQVEVDRPRVLVLPIENRTELAQNDAVARTVTDTMTLTLRLLDAYELLPPGTYTSDDAIGLSPAELGDLATALTADNVIFGAVDIDDQGVLTFSVSVYDHATGEITVRANSRAESIFDIFDASDDLITDAVSGFSGVRIGFGSLQLEAEGEGDFLLYLDGSLVGKNITAVDRVLIGSRALEIRQERADREAVIHRQTLEIEEDQAHIVAFAFPVVTEEEQRREEELRAAIAWRLDSGVDPQGTGELIDELEELYTELEAGFVGGLREISFYRDRLALARAMQGLALVDLEALAGEEADRVSDVVAEYRAPWDITYRQYLIAADDLPDDPAEGADLEPHQFTAEERFRLVESDVRRNLTTFGTLASLERAGIVDEAEADLVDGYTAVTHRVRQPQAALPAPYDDWRVENRYINQAMIRYRRADERRRPFWHWIAGGVGVGALGYAGYVQFAGLIENREEKVEELIPQYESSTDFDEIVALRSEIQDAENQMAALELTRDIAIGAGATLLSTAVIARIVSLTRPARAWRRYRDDAYLDRWTAAGLDYRERSLDPGGPPQLLVLGREESFTVTGVHGALTTPQMLPGGTDAWELEHLSAAPGDRRAYEIPARSGVQILYLGVQQ